MDPATKQKLTAAQEAYEHAAQELARVTAECYPEGQQLTVILGAAVVTGKVIRAGGNAWCNPDEVLIENVVTGKARHFAGAALDLYHPEFLQS